MGLFDMFSRKAKKPAARREFSSSSYASPTRRDGAFSYPNRKRDDRTTSSDDGYTAPIITSYDDTPSSNHNYGHSHGLFGGHGGSFGGGGSSDSWGDSGGYSGGGDSGGGGGGDGGGGGGDVTCNLSADPMFNRHRHWRLTI